MHKKIQRFTRVKNQWRAHRQLVGACTLGFVIGWMINVHAPLRALLVNDVMMRYSTSSRSMLRPAAPAAVRLTRPVYRMRSSRSSSSRSMAPLFHQAAPVRPVTGPLQGVIIRPVVQEAAFDRTVFPVSQVPNWGAMHAAAEWNRSYAQMNSTDFVPTPSYDLEKLSTPFRELVRDKETKEITRKLFYSTKFLGRYDLDAGEYTGTHPGVDLKLAPGTPIGAIAGGRVQTVASDDILGLHVIIEHKIGWTTVYSIYGHFGATMVQEGQVVTPGQTIGFVGSTGSTTGPHLHLQVDQDDGTVPHEAYHPSQGTSVAEALKRTINPIQFIQRYGKGI